MNDKPRVGTEAWNFLNPDKFCIHNLHYDLNGNRIAPVLLRPWASERGMYYREHETFQDALNYVQDKAALL